MEKELELERAPVGVIGLETAFAVAYTTLVHTDRMKLVDLIKRMSLAPANRFGLVGGSIAEGATANLALLDLKERWRVSEAQLHSRSHNSPFLGHTLRGRAVATIYRGRLVYRAQPVDEPLSSIV